MSRIVQAIRLSRGSLSSISRINLATRMATVWCRSKVEVNRFLGNPPPTTREYTCPFPYEIVEMIIAHLTDDLTTLKACSLTSRSWYIVAVQHLHHTLTLKEDVPSSTGDKTNPRSIHDKLRPLSELHDLGLMPLVGEIRVDHGYSMDSWFVPKVFSRRDLWYFSTFTNVHTLRLQNFEIDQFIPGIKHFFGNFSPTLRSITLHRLRCDPQHLSHFLSLFSNLDNIELMYTIMSHGEGAEPIPSSTPTRKLRGRLAIYGSYQPEAWSHLIASCGGLQFHHIDLRKGASCAFVLLEACAKTLETLRFDAEAALDRNLNLSGLKVLRSLQVAAWVFDSRRLNHRHTMVVDAFSTIRSPVFSELVVVLARLEIYLPWVTTLFKALRMMNELRPFDLVFLLEVLDFRQAQRELLETLDLVTAKGLLDFLDSPPTIRVLDMSSPSNRYLSSMPSTTPNFAVL